MWWVREGEGRGDVGSPGGDQGMCTVPGKPGTSVPGTPGLGLSPHIPTLTDDPRGDQAQACRAPQVSKERSVPLVSWEPWKYWHTR